MANLRKIERRIESLREAGHADDADMLAQLLRSTRETSRKYREALARYEMQSNNHQRMRAALECYANPKNWDASYHRVGAARGSRGGKKLFILSTWPHGFQYAKEVLERVQRDETEAGRRENEGLK